MKLDATIPNAPCARCGEIVEDGRLFHRSCFEDAKREEREELMRALASDLRFAMPGRNVIARGF